MVWVPVIMVYWVPPPVSLYLLTLWLWLFHFYYHYYYHYKHCWPQGSLSQFSAVTGQISTLGEKFELIKLAECISTHVPQIDLIHDLSVHVFAGLREGPVQLAGGVDRVPGAYEGSDITVINSVSWNFSSDRSSISYYVHLSISKLPLCCLYTVFTLSLSSLQAVNLTYNPRGWFQSVILLI